MAKDHDLADYIEMFEANMNSREIPKHAWAKHLVPLLHSRVTPSIASLPPADKLNFDVLKETLLATAYATTKYASRALWLSHKKTDASLKAYGNQLLRLCKRFTEGAESVHDACELFAAEKFIQELPPDVADYVREKEPKKVGDAADLAAKQFTLQNIDEFKYDSSKPWTGKAKDKHNEDKSFRDGKGRFGGGWHSAKRYSKQANTHEQEATKPPDQVTGQGPKGDDNNKGPNAKADSGSSSKKFNGNCHICGKWGHRAADCRSRVSVAVVPCLTEPAADALVVEGLIDGQKVSGMLCDSGANISMISEHLIPKEPKFCGYVVVGSVGDHTNTYRAILVPTILFGKSFKLFVAVAPRSHLPADVILGRNIPDLVITWSVGDVQVSTSQEKLKQTENVSDEERAFIAGSYAKSTRDSSNHHSGDNLVGNQPAQERIENKKIKSVTFKSETSPILVQGVVADLDTEGEKPQKHSRRKKKFSTHTLQLNEPANQNQFKPLHTSTNVEMMDLGNCKGARVLAVQTRAQKLKAEKLIKEDDEATARSGARVWTSDHSQQDEEGGDGSEWEEDGYEEGGDGLEEEEGSSEEESEFTEDQQTCSGEPGVEQKSRDAPSQCTEEKTFEVLVGNGPEKIVVTRDMLIKGQLEDDTLPDLTQGRDDLSSSYYVKDNILYKKRFNAVALEGDEEKDEGRGDQDEDGLIMVPNSLKTTVMRTGHDLAGHFGVKKTKKMIAQHFYWRKMGSDIARFCKTCPQCQAYSNSPDKRPPLKPLPVITDPWERLAMDIVGPLNRTPSGNRFILTLMDFGTRFPEAIPLRSTDAKTTCNALMEAFSNFGVPKEILSDNGTNFVAAVTQQLLKELHCVQLKISPYHPQSNGMLERAHAVLKKTLVKLGATKSDWDRYLPHTLMAMRSAPHTALGVSPFHLMFGRDARTPLAVLKEKMTLKKQVPRNVLDYMEDLYKKMETSQKIVEEMDTKAKAKSKKQKAKMDPLKEGELVLAMTPTGKLGTLCKWEGPYRIKRRLTDMTYLVEAPVRGKLGKRRCNRQSLKRYFVRVAATRVITATADEEGIDKMRLDHGGDAVVTDDTKWEKLELGRELGKEQKEELSALLNKYSDVFQDKPGKATVNPVSIPTGSSSPVTTYPYRTPNRWKDKIQTEIDTLLEYGIIEPSTSPWASPIVPVPKPGGDVRMCVDYRKLNKVTETDTYPLPRVEKILEEVSASQYITTLDLSKGYYQFPIVPSHQKKTAFVTESGKWQFTRMPFGLKGAPAAFQREMDSLFQACPNILAYIDDVAIFSSSWSQHLKNRH